MNKEYNDIALKIQSRLENYFKSYINEYEQYFNEVINYSLLAGGKRLRPILLYKSAQIFNGNLDVAIELATAIEMIHTYSLIHDDLPAMDNDTYRRGQLTSHVKYPEAMAILAGDGLLNYAYEIMFDVLIKYGYNEKTIKSMQFIAKSAGIKGMIGGQVVDIKTENIDIDNSTLNYIIENKTSKLIKASILSGAMLGDITESELIKLEKIADDIGFSFQLIDDYLDVVGKPEFIGKSTGKDKDIGKNTYVKYHGSKQTYIDSNNYLNNAKSLLDSMDRENLNFYYDIIEFLKNREK